MRDKAIICDMDGTLVQYPDKPFHSTWDALSLAFSEDKREKWIETRDFYLKKGGGYQEWFDAQLDLLKGTPMADISSHLFPIPYSNGVVPFFKGLNGNHLTGIISAGVNVVAERIAEELGFEFQYSNYLEIAKGEFTGEGEIRVGLDGKVKILSELMKKHDLKPKDIVFVGDGYGDIPAFEVVGVPVAYGRKFDEVTKVVNERNGYVIDDFRELNDILNIRR